MLQCGGKYTTETWILLWWNYHHRLHWKLLFWQLQVQPMMKSHQNEEISFWFNMDQLHITYFFNSYLSINIVAKITFILDVYIVTQHMEEYINRERGRERVCVYPKKYAHYYGTLLWFCARGIYPYPWSNLDQYGWINYMNHKEQGSLLLIWFIFNLSMDK